MAEGDPQRRRDGFSDATAFISGLRFDDVPQAVVLQATRCLLDLIGVAAAGSRTHAASIVNAYAATELCGRDRNARLLFSGRRASIAGAAFAGATTIDAVDAHDGHALTKGHAGVAIFPSLLAGIDGGLATEITGTELITCLVVGYEIATRAGIALHSTAADYHCSGAWNALGCAAVIARLLKLDRKSIRHALGIAEYVGPRGPIMRVCESPSMLKDGSGWGAHAGVSAALLAREHFTGAPALSIESGEVKPHWTDLGARWRLSEQYLKPYPVCRWAQPAIEAALTLSRGHGFTAQDVASLTVETFREAAALGSHCARPETTEDAQYSLKYPVAAALVFGTVGANEITEPSLHHPLVLKLIDRITVTEKAEFSRRFPAQRLARVKVKLANGEVLVSEPTTARGDPHEPLTDDELRRKYRSLATPVLGDGRALRIERAVTTLTTDPSSLSILIGELLATVA